MPILTERERIGTRLAGKYDLSAIIGRGGMGTIYAGVHAWTGRRVAVKLLKPALAEDANVARRFLREARAAAAIHHPHVVDVLDMGQEDDGAVYMVLELLEGESLATLLRRRGVMKPEELLPIVLPVADALADVHAKGLVHRDLKPDNVFVARGRGDRTIPKLLDFGIAKILEDTGGSQGTRTGAIVGTPHYMSPEQASGSGEIGPASDVWSLGVLLYECLTGRLPFEADTVTGVLVKILTSTPPSVTQLAPDVPRPLARVIEHAMQTEPAARFLDGRVMRDALRDAARALEITIPDEVPPDTSSPSGLDVAIEVTRSTPGGGRRASPSDAIESAPTIESQSPARREPSVAPAQSVQLPGRRRVWAVTATGVVALAVAAYLAGVASSGHRDDAAEDAPDEPSAASAAPEDAPRSIDDRAARQDAAVGTPMAAIATTPATADDTTTDVDDATSPESRDATSREALDATSPDVSRARPDRRSGARPTATRARRDPEPSVQVRDDTADRDDPEEPASAPTAAGESARPGVRTEW